MVKQLESNPRVLIVIRNGMAEFATDESIEVEIFNLDEFSGDLGALPSHQFRDLAEVMGVPCAQCH